MSEVFVETEIYYNSDGVYQGSVRQYPNIRVSSCTLAGVRNELVKAVKKVVGDSDSKGGYLKIVESLMDN